MKKNGNLKTPALLLVLSGLTYGLHMLLMNVFGAVVKNSGISFGIGKNAELLSFIGLTFIFICLNSRFNLGLSLMFIGGLANFLDRLRLGYVVDYWNINGGLYNNLNDWIIFFGVIIFILELWKKTSK